MSDAHDEYRDALAMALWMLRQKRDEPRFWTKAQRAAFARVVERIEAAAWQPDTNGKLAVAAEVEAQRFALSSLHTVASGKSKRLDAANAAADLAIWMARVALYRGSPQQRKSAIEYMRGGFVRQLLSIKVKP